MSEKKMLCPKLCLPKIRGFLRKNNIPNFWWYFALLWVTFKHCNRFGIGFFSSQRSTSAASIIVVHKKSNSQHLIAAAPILIWFRNSCLLTRLLIYDQLAKKFNLPQLPNRFPTTHLLPTTLFMWSKLIICWEFIRNYNLIVLIVIIVFAHLTRSLSACQDRGLIREWLVIKD